MKYILIMSSQTWTLKVYTPQQAEILSSLNNGKPVIAPSFCTSKQENSGNKRCNEKLSTEVTQKLKLT